MSRVIWTKEAVRDVERLVDFLEGKNPGAAMDARYAIIHAASILEQFPDVGLIVRQDPLTRELVTSFGSSGYVLRYRYAPDNRVVIVRVWHGREDR
ncbi:type II toxin-antitoxin system RelE/ParE family toxin [Methylococcus sp. EFPC2]|uniref:type II toxin-antitoxin system RelE/ParE family toxin n=1 Tax=Methylococcus sp. EFPC2 TaxID=2812648 RepID=UPI0019683E2D|nr:type II toxin-antitoxin system RelE/ParE family toxin [Methylococcus sp. EFPC2]QSA98488.1 type II toxin-antitoxin system RelE/ParE family toxin [Methylococcus sp. EFPC2]